MAAAKHRIARQVFELTVADAQTAQELQARTARLQRTRLLSELERWLDAMAPADGTIRIERLSIDLGTLPAGGFDAALIAALDRALPPALAAALAQQAQTGSDAAEGADLELIEHLLATGNLPWWGDPARRDVLDAAIERTARATPARLASLLRRRFAADVGARRAARHLGPRRLGRLVDLLVPGRGRDARDIGAGLLRAATAVERWRLALPLWSAVLQTAADGTHERLGFWRDALARLAAARGLSARALLEELKPSARGSAAELIHRLIAELPPARPGASDAEAVLARFGALIEGERGPVALLARLRAALKPRPAAAAALAVLIDALAGALERGDADATLAAAGALIAAARQRDLMTGDALLNGIERWAEQLGGLDPRRVRALAGSVEPAGLSRPPPTTRPDDDLQVMNAGLVILWPFLTAFFTRLDLIDGRAFRDEATVARAVGLLELIAAADPKPPEYRLGLNKLLCGLDPNAPWQIDGPPSARERDECAALLDAVIARAPILRSMSHDGLRGSFLLRTGSLRPDPAGWLLRVERTSYDVVLDRFPWPMGWVKLPWMPAPLRVDW